MSRGERNIVFRSPRRLNPQLRYKARTPASVKETLSVWLLLSIAIWGFDHETWGGVTVTSLRHSSRAIVKVKSISSIFQIRNWKNVMGAMQ